ncbi:hypothetical protein AT15_03925 [Kosmotoga arenicorallina S304]|uniref:DUF5050 domain-containing protein n=1 Tax=Kosmotoga arenicorallina S304 TaxID=1453497 RepID=A0A176JYW5_9BACT|nr:hypothetical protein [Kosmotoga arenicorallina]OAA29147.1 hypothetical protein AT15_03925 [Kosmotoga arenicorallina S304]
MKKSRIFFMIFILLSTTFILAEHSASCSPTDTSSKTVESFLTLANSTIIEISNEGSFTTGIKAHSFCVDNEAKLLFTLNEIYDYSSGKFLLLRTYDSLTGGYIYAGFGIIASVHNDTDDIDFYDYDGNFIKTIEFSGNPVILQSAYGIFLDNNTFLLSEDGYNNVIKVNISDGTAEIFKSFDFGWLGVFAKHEDSYYIYTSAGNAIYKFSASTDPVLIDDGFPAHVTGIVAEESILYFVSNFGNGFYSYNMESGELTKIADLNYPQGLYKITYNVLF